MSKHTNKHWLREKEFISLKTEHSDLWVSLPRVRWRLMPNTRMEEIDRKLLYKFYNEYHGHWNTAPKHYRKSLNRIQRAKAKQVLHRLLKGDDDFIFEDNYRGCNWYW
jgi:hypothetical protein